MNKENMQIVLDRVKASLTEKEPTFSYGCWFIDHTRTHPTVADAVEHPCGTVSCIGGIAALLQVYLDAPYAPLTIEKARLRGPGPLTASRANAFLGLSRSEGAYLYLGDWHARGVRAPVEDVIAKLENIIETGEVRNPEFDAKYL